MPEIKLYLKSTVMIPAKWCTEQEWDDLYGGNLEALKKLFIEDYEAFIDNLDPIGLITDAEWVD